jgi:DNA-binding GntR family transcriptional regulator
MSETIAEQIYRGLIDQIMKGQLKPGQRVEEQAVASHYGASRTPVRDALRQLAGSGFIEFRPHRGAMVSDLDLRQMGEMFEALEEMEALCAKFAAQRMKTIERHQLEALVQRQKGAIEAKKETLYWQLNDEFHHLIYRGADNRSILQLTDNLRSRLMPFRVFMFERGHRMQAAYVEHVDVVKAILASDSEKAYLAMRHHVANSNVRVMNFLQARIAETKDEAPQQTPKPRRRRSTKKR